jgi:hypothetical protein
MTGANERFLVTLPLKVTTLVSTLWVYSKEIARLVWVAHNDNTFCPKSSIGKLTSFVEIRSRSNDVEPILC